MFYVIFDRYLRTIKNLDMKQPNFSSELLLTFVTIIETGGFIRAAEHLYKTQSTISQHIKRLQQEVGTELFTLSGRRQVLTPAGEIFLGYAKRMLALQNEAVSAVMQTSIKDKIRIGVSHSISEGIFPELLGRFARSYPGVEMEVEIGNSLDIIQAYDQGKYDLSLTLEKELTGGELLGTEDMVWIGKEGFEWSPSFPLPLSSYQDPCHFRQASIHALDQAGIPWQMVYSANSLTGLMAAVRAGLAVTVRARNAVSAGTEIITPRIDLPELPQVQVVLRNRTGSKASELLASALKNIDMPVA